MSDQPEYMEPPALNDVGPAKVDVNPSLSLPVGSRRERAVILAAAIFQLFVMVAMIGGNVVPFVGAETVLLRVAPVDPRDLMRGDYVILSYEISRVPSNLRLNKLGGAPDDRTVYVSLVPEEDGRHYRGAGVSLTPPPTGLFILGTLQGWNMIQFGIESYYVQEGRGHDYEKAVREHRLSAEVAINKNGGATLRNLVIE